MFPSWWLLREQWIRRGTHMPPMLCPACGAPVVSGRLGPSAEPNPCRRCGWRSSTPPHRPSVGARDTAGTRGHGAPSAAAPPRSPATERAEVSELFSLASLARSAPSSPHPPPDRGAGVAADSTLVDFAALGWGQHEAASAAAPVVSAVVPASPFVPPPLGGADALGTPLPLVSSPVPGSGRGRHAGWLFPVGGVAFAVLGLTVALLVPEPSETPLDPRAPSSAPRDGAGAPGAAASASPAGDTDAPTPVPSTAPAPSTAPSASATAPPRRVPPLRRPPPPRPTATNTAPERPPPSRDPCARCGADLACNIACKAGG